MFEEIEQRRPQTLLGIDSRDGLLLNRFVKENAIKSIVETGVCFGFSSAYFLEALGKDGFLVSIEPNLKSLKELVVPAEFYSKWLAIENYSDHVLDWVLSVFKPELFFHDSRHFYDTMMFEYTTAHKYKPRFIGSDDIDWSRSDRAWYDFLEKYNYVEVCRGARFAIAKERVCC